MISNKDRSAEELHMKLQKVSDNCYAVLCDSKSSPRPPHTLR